MFCAECSPEEETLAGSKVLDPHPLVVHLVPFPPVGGAKSTENLWDIGY